MRSLPALPGFLSFALRRLVVTFEVRKEEEVPSGASFVVFQDLTAIRTVFAGLMAEKTGLIAVRFFLVSDTAVSHLTHSDCLSVHVGRHRARKVKYFCHRKTPS